MLHVGEESTKVERGVWVAEKGKYESCAVEIGGGVTKVRRLKRNVERRKYES